MAKQEKDKQVATQEQVQSAKQQVETVGQAIHVLVQAADLGRKAGVYNWDDLILISQAIDLLKKPVEQSRAEVKKDVTVATEE